MMLDLILKSKECLQSMQHSTCRDKGDTFEAGPYASTKFKPAKYRCGCFEQYKCFPGAEYLSLGDLL